MLTRCLGFMGTIAALLIIASCGTLPAQRETLLDRNWGRSFESAKYNQILNPDAEKNLDPVEGLDGQAAERNMEKYRKEPERPPSRDYEVFSIKR